MSSGIPKPTSAPTIPPAAAPIAPPATVVAKAVAAAPPNITGPTPGIAKVPRPTNKPVNPPKAVPVTAPTLAPSSDLSPTRSLTSAPAISSLSPSCVITETLSMSKPVFFNSCRACSTSRRLENTPTPRLCTPTTIIFSPQDKINYLLTNKFIAGNNPNVTKKGANPCYGWV